VTLDWDQLQIHHHDLRLLDEQLSEEEVRMAVFQTPVVAIAEAIEHKQ
jgi:hypothetical protein